MSNESAAWLNTMCLIGLVEQYGPAWHNDPSLRAQLGVSDNHFDGPVPLDAVERLLSFNLVSASIRAETEIITPDGVTAINKVDPTRQAICRSDTGDILGIFKAGYKIHHYRDVLLDATSRLVGDPMAADLGMQIKSVGLLRNGAVAWSQIVSPAELYAGSVKAQPFILASTSCDGSRATRFTTGSQLVVCDNTLDAALLPGVRANSISIRHSRDSLGRLEDVGQALGILTAESRLIAGMVDMLANTTINEKEQTRFIDLTFGEKPKPAEVNGRVNTTWVTKWENRVGEFMSIMNSSAVAPFAGTAFGLFQSVSTYNHHKRPRVTMTLSGNPLERNARDAITGSTAESDGETLKNINNVLKGSRRKQLVFA